MKVFWIYSQFLFLCIFSAGECFRKCTKFSRTAILVTILSYKQKYSFLGNVPQGVGMVAFLFVKYKIAFAAVGARIDSLHCQTRIPFSWINLPPQRQWQIYYRLESCKHIKVTSLSRNICFRLYDFQVFHIFDAVFMICFKELYYWSCFSPENKFLRWQ